ncbi:hypothetical protein MAR_020716 [Mya arenaria]|uniref:Uncharacterized protein n=1 Tax=Mya arenaria TaxID=6604 RepID=A0ABY7E5R0_MYAAR|nr:hypothetical protein MAR_020716 [Mya arenaria]
MQVILFCFLKYQSAYRKIFVSNVMGFRKSGLLLKNLNFEYNREKVEVVNAFHNSDFVFTAGGSINQTKITLAAQ